MNEYRFSDIEVGREEHFTKVITPAMEDMFRELTGDENPLHRDDTFAQEVGGGMFPGHVTFGMLTSSFLSTLAGVYLPGKYSLIHSIDQISFKKPVFAGDELTVSGVVREKQEDLKLLLLDVKITNGGGKVVAKAQMKVLVLE